MVLKIEPLKELENEELQGLRSDWDSTGGLYN
jgi:hypothetical protein